MSVARKNGLIAISLLLLCVAGFGYVVLSQKPGSSESLPEEGKHAQRKVPARSNTVGKTRGVQNPQSLKGKGDKDDPAMRPAGSESSRERMRSRSLESALVRSGSLRGDVVARMIASDEFDDVLTRIRSESIGDQDAIELARIYGEAITSAVEQSGDGEIQGFACGLSICGVDISSDSSGGERYFSSILDSKRRSGAPVYSAVTEVVPLPNGRYSYRMIFSTDPGASSIQVPPGKTGN